MGGNNTKNITGHSNNQVINRFYIDQREMAKAARGFKVFSDENERKDELNELRNDSKDLNQEHLIER